MTKNANLVSLDRIRKANMNIKGVVKTTPLQFVQSLSDKYDANIFFKREDLQVVRSYKLRGAYNKITSLSKDDLKNGIVCASAGNHAQGVAFACKALQVHGVIFMPITTPMQKVQQVRMFGGEMVEIQLVGDTFDESFHASMEYCEAKKSSFVHPFDDIDVIAGQGTVGF